MTNKLKELAKGAARRLFGTPGKLSDADSKSLEMWTEHGFTGERNALASKRTPHPSEALRQGNKLAARTKTRKGANGEREYLLHRGMSDQELADAHESGEGYSNITSWTPHYNVALKFARDYNEVGHKSFDPEAPPTELAHNHVKSVWVPESKIAFVPNQLGHAGVYSGEHEVVVHPFKPNYAHPDETKVMRAKAHYPGYEPDVPDFQMGNKVKQEIKEGKPLQERFRPRMPRAQLPLPPSLEHRTKAKFGKSLRKSSEPKADFPPGPLDASQNAEPRWGGHETQVYHGLNPHANLMQPADPGVTHQIRFIGDASGTPRAVIKAPLGHRDLKIRRTDPDGPQTSFMMNPDFRTTHREAAYHMLADKVFGLGEFVPKTTVFRHGGTGEPWSAQEFVPHAEMLRHPGTQIHRYKDELHRLAFMDAILGHNDRHGANTLVDRHGRLHLIDNAGAFDYAHRFQTPTPKYALHIQHEDVSPDTHKWLASLSSKRLAEHLRQAGAPADIAMMALKRLAEAQRWSKVVQGHKESSGQLNGGLQVVQSHRFGDPQFLSEARKMAYDRIRRGEDMATAPSDSSNPDQTQIQRPK